MENLLTGIDDAETRESSEPSSGAPGESREPSGARRFTLAQAHQAVVTERAASFTRRDDDTPLHPLADE